MLCPRAMHVWSHHGHFTPPPHHLIRAVLCNGSASHKETSACESTALTHLGHECSTILHAFGSLCALFRYCCHVRLPRSFGPYSVRKLRMLPLLRPLSRLLATRFPFVRNFSLLQFQKGHTILSTHGNSSGPSSCARRAILWVLPLWFVRERCHSPSHPRTRN